MSSIRSLVWRVWRILDGGTPTDDSKFTYGELRDHVRSAIKVALKANYFEQLNAGESRYGDDSLAKAYDATIQEDVATGLKYVDLPGETISVPASSRTTTISDPNPFSIWATEYIPVRMEEAFSYKLQDDIPCVVLYTQVGDRIEFFNDEVETGKAIKVIRKYSVTDDDDEELGLPGEYENQVVAQALQLANPMLRPDDRDNNGVPIQFS